MRKFITSPGVFLADGDGIPPALDVANLRLSTFGEEHAPEDTGGKEGAKRVMGRGFLWEPCKIRDSLHHGRSLPPIICGMTAGVLSRIVDISVKGTTKHSIVGRTRPPG